MLKNKFEKFRDFALKGNVVDMAVGIVIGSSFGKIATSLVNDVIMPPVALLLGQADVRNLFISLDGKAYPSLSAAKRASAATLNYGAFLATVVDFLIVAMAMFLIVQWFQTVYQRSRQLRALDAARVKNCPYCLTAIAVAATRCPNCTSQLEPKKA